MRGRLQPDKVRVSWSRFKTRQMSLDWGNIAAWQWQVDCWTHGRHGLNGLFCGIQLDIDYSSVAQKLNFLSEMKRIIKSPTKCCKIQLGKCFFFQKILLVSSILRHSWSMERHILEPAWTELSQLLQNLRNLPCNLHLK